MQNMRLISNLNFKIKFFYNTYKYFGLPTSVKKLLIFPMSKFNSLNLGSFLLVLWFPATKLKKPYWKLLQIYLNDLLVLDDGELLSNFIFIFKPVLRNQCLKGNLTSQCHNKKTKS